MTVRPSRSEASMSTPPERAGNRKCREVTERDDEAGDRSSRSGGETRAAQLAPPGSSPPRAADPLSAALVRVPWRIRPRARRRDMPDARHARGRPADPCTCRRLREVPLRPSIGQATRHVRGGHRLPYRLMGEGAVGAAAVDHDLAVVGQLEQASLELLERGRGRAGSTQPPRGSQRGPPRSRRVPPPARSARRGPSRLSRPRPSASRPPRHPLGAPPRRP
jgi:hypothetical protein